MAKDINIPVKAEGADAAKEKLDAVAKSVEQLGQKTEDASRQSQRASTATGQLTDAQDKQQGVLGTLIGRVGSWAAGLLGVTAAINLVTKAVSEQKQAMEESSRILENYQNKLLRLQFLGDLFQERPELRQEVMSLAEYGRRPVEQVADAWYNLRSKSGGLSDSAQMGILKEALEMGRTDPSLQLDTLVDMFSLYAKQSGVTDANQIQNVLQQTITDAGGSGADVAAYMPQFLPVGIAGGLSPAQAAGLWAYVTTQQDSPSRATTGLRATFMGLQGKGTPEGQKLLSGFGVTPQMDFMQKINQLSQANISLADAEQIAGREGAPIFLSMINDPAGMMRTIGNVTAVDRGDIDLTKTKIDRLFSMDPIAKSEEDLRLLDIKVKNEKAGNKDALPLREIMMSHELKQRQKGVSEFRIRRELDAIELLGSLGLSPEHAYAIGSNIINDDRKMNFLGAGGPLYRAIQEWNITKDEIMNPSGGTVINNFNNDYSSNLYRSEGTASPRVPTE